jgi:hypothetical protein
MDCPKQSTQRWYGTSLPLLMYRPPRRGQTYSPGPSAGTHEPRYTRPTPTSPHAWLALALQGQLPVPAMHAAGGFV